MPIIKATGKDKLLNCACRYADFVAARFGREEGKCKGYPGHEIAEMALAGLYEKTGEDKYLELAKFFVDERGTRPYYFDVEDPTRVPQGKEKELRYEYNQAHKPVREQEEAVGHAVRAAYLYSGMTDVARITKDETLYQACETLWENVTNKKMYITGAIGGTRMEKRFLSIMIFRMTWHTPKPAAAMGTMFWARRMLEIRPDRKYADAMERALYNSVLSGMDLDGKAFFYVNPLEVLPEACHKDSRKFHVKPVRQKWFGCACCPPNLARLLSSIGRYAYGENKNTLFVHLYIGGVIKKQVGEEEIQIILDSDMP
ncbi:MAG: beta-L-arabinofuranosidase domain-containing protein [Eubacterium ramulus]